MFDFKIPKRLRGKKINTKVKQEIEFQEVLLDALSQKKEAFFQKKFEVPLPKRVFFIFFASFLFLILFLVVKAGQLQILQHEKFATLAKQNFQRLYFERPTRGVIYDQNHNQIAFNDSSFDLVCIKQDLPHIQEEREEILKSVAKLSGLDFSELEAKINENDKNRILVLENLEHEKLVVLGSGINNLSGFEIEENISRLYESGPTFSHILGYLGRINEQELKNFSNYSSLDYLGKSGLEKQYEKTLRGQMGELVVERDVLFSEISRERKTKAEPGNSLVLWLDSDLQKKTTQALQDSIDRVGSGAGIAIIMDIRNGAVLSSVSLPSFDNNLFFQKLSEEEWQEIIGDPFNPFWNRCVSGAYPTGSTIKPLIAVAALEEGIVWPKQDFLCEGEIEVPNPWYPEEPWFFHDWTTHGWVDMRKAIAESCNVYFYTIGGGYGNFKGLGAERIKKYLQLFGWGEKTGIDLPEERQGLIPSKEWKEEHFDGTEEIWLPGDTYNLSIGQGYVSVSPIQVVNSFAALANGGKLFKPQIVKEIIDENKNIVQSFEPEIIKQDFIDEASLRVVKEGMREAVLYGSSVTLNNLSVKAAAKTGTAQTARPGYYHNWVTVFAPYDDPEIVLTVMIEHVEEEQVAALPVAKEILGWYFQGSE